MSMKIGDVEIDFEPNDSNAEIGEKQKDGSVKYRPMTKEERHEERAKAVKQFRSVMQKQVMEQIEQQAQILCALLIQLRAVGGSMAGTELPNLLQEQIEFMQDIDGEAVEVKGEKDSDR